MSVTKIIVKSENVSGEGTPTITATKVHEDMDWDAFVEHVHFAEHLTPFMQWSESQGEVYTRFATYKLLEI